MPKQRNQVPMEVRLVIAANLRREMTVHPDEALHRATSLSKAAGVGRRTVNRLLNPQEYPDHGPELASLIALADTLGVPVYQLFMPPRVGRRPLLEGDLAAPGTVKVSSTFAVRNAVRKAKK